MLNKHFFKTLIIFVGLILFGIISTFLVSYFDKDSAAANPINPANVAK